MSYTQAIHKRNDNMKYSLENNYLATKTYTDTTTFYISAEVLKHYQACGMNSFRFTVHTRFTVPKSTLLIVLFDICDLSFASLWIHYNLEKKQQKALSLNLHNFAVNNIAIYRISPHIVEKSSVQNKYIGPVFSSNLTYQRLSLFYRSEN